MNVDPRSGAAFLPAKPESRTRRSFDRLVEVRIVHDDHGVFAPPLGGARLRTFAVELSVHVTTNSGRACEHDAIDIRVRGERLSDFVTTARHEVQRTERQTGIAQAFEHFDAG